MPVTRLGLAGYGVQREGSFAGKTAAPIISTITPYSATWRNDIIKKLAALASNCVSSIAGNTGAFTLGTGLTNSVNEITLAVAAAATIKANNTASSAIPTDVNAATVGSSMVLVQSQTVSAVASVAFTGLDTTYDRYEIIISGAFPATDSTTLQLQVGTGATPTWQTGASSYRYTLASLTETANVQDGSSADNSIRLGGAQANSSGNPLNGTIELDRITSAVFLPITFNTTNYDGTNIRAVRGSGLYTGAGSITAIRFIQSSGNLSGTFALYGIRKA